MNDLYYDGYSRKTPLVRTPLTDEADAAIRIAVEKAVVAGMTHAQFSVRAENMFLVVEDEHFKDEDE